MCVHVHVRYLINGFLCFIMYMRSWFDVLFVCFVTAILLVVILNRLLYFLWGLLKPGIGWDWMGSDGTWSRVLAFGTFGSRVPDFDVIAITDLIYFSPLAMNDRERMCIVLAGLIDLLQSIYQNFIIMLYC